MSHPAHDTVITAERNAAHELEATLASVAEQTHPNVWHIVIDGGSDDGTQTVLERHARPGLRYLSQPDTGPYHGMNRGLALATEESYVTFLNAGDRYTSPETIAQVFDGLDSSAVDLVYGDVVAVETDGTQRRVQAKAFTKDVLLAVNTAAVCHQAMFVRRSVAPPYDLRYRLKAELNWYFDLLDRRPPIRWIYRDLPVVLYAIGGLSYRHYLRDRVEWLEVVQRRHGWWPFLRYNYPLQLGLGLARHYRLKPRLAQWLGGGRQPRR
jgi:glycosyltransferase involved in cell wall biosynthesis